MPPFRARWMACVPIRRTPMSRPTLFEIMNKLTNSSDIPVDHDGPRIWSRCLEMQEWRYRYHEAGS